LNGNRGTKVYRNFSFGPTSFASRFSPIALFSRFNILAGYADCFSFITVFSRSTTQQSNKSNKEARVAEYSTSTSLPFIVDHANPSSIQQQEWTVSRSVVSNRFVP